MLVLSGEVYGGNDDTSNLPFLFFWTDDSSNTISRSKLFCCTDETSITNFWHQILCWDIIILSQPSVKFMDCQSSVKHDLYKKKFMDWQLTLKHDPYQTNFMDCQLILNYDRPHTKFIDCQSTVNHDTCQISLMGAVIAVTLGICANLRRTSQRSGNPPQRVSFCKMAEKIILDIFTE